MLLQPVFALRQDAFSQVLDILRLRGTTVQAGAVLHPQTVAFDHASPCIYVVQQGLLQFNLRRKRVWAEQGDVVLLVRGGSHSVTCAPGCPPDDKAKHRRQVASYLRGEFAFDGIFAERFLGVLPEIILLKRPEDRPYEWVELACGFILDEAIHGLAGATAMVSRLLDLLFVRTLRTWAGEADGGYGWLSGVVDARISRTLAAMHQDPANNWTLSALAELASMSRTGFAKRFLSVVGETPVAYLNGWRLDRAAELLRYPGLSVGAIASRIGYTSNAAFSRAFKLRYTSAPMQWRKTHQLVATEQSFR